MNLILRVQKSAWVSIDFINKRVQVGAYYEVHVPRMVHVVTATAFVAHEHILSL